VVLVVTPTTGISLPYVSAGGSGLLTACVLAGFLAAIAGRSETSTNPSLTQEAARHEGETAIRW